MDSKIDNNGENNALAMDTGGVIKPLLVDPVTGALLMELVAFVESPTVMTAPKIDDNAKEVAVAVDDNGIIKPLLTDADGYLLIDLCVE